MNNEKLIMDNKELPVGAAWHAAQKIKTTHGITLIALIITIIVMLILAGVVLSLTIGERGIFKTAQNAGQKMEEAEAREKLELVLLDLQTDKVTDINYNETEYINTKIQVNEMVVDGDIVFVNGWQFQIDRSVPEIIANLGKGQPEEQIQIGVISTTSSDYMKATIKIEITYEKEIVSILLNGENIEIPEKQDGKYVIEKDVTSNGTYSVIAKDAEDKYNTKSIKISDVTEDMDIYTVEQLVAFEKRVNTGATFEGRTVRLKDDLNLENINWKPIGYWKSEDDYIAFKGTFDGENHTINNMKINVTEEYDTNSGIAFIGVMNGELKNLNFNNPNVYSEVQAAAVAVGDTILKADGTDYSKIENVKVLKGEIAASKDYTGGICATISGEIINCYSNCNITSEGNYTGGICGNAYEASIEKCYNTGIITSKAYVGGICGSNSATTAKSCYNTGNITSTGKNAGGSSLTGGIIGFNTNTSIVENCYNIGDVTATYQAVGGIVGYNGSSSQGTQRVENVFNTGTIKKGTVTATDYTGTSSNYIGTLIGRYGTTLAGKYDNTTIEDMQSWDKDTIAENLGKSFKKNTNSNVNQGLPILTWQ